MTDGDNRAATAAWLGLRAGRATAVVVVFAAAWTEWVAFPWRMPLVALLALALLRLERGGLAAAGLARPAGWRPLLGYAVVAFVVTVGLIDPFLEPLVNHLTNTQPDLSGYGALEGNVPGVLRLGLYALFSAAIAEEIVFRGFLIHQLEGLLGRGAAARVLIVLVAGGLFGVAHGDQGLAGIVLTGLVGAWFCILFLASRNLWALMLGHGLVDAWGLYQLYRGWI